LESSSLLEETRSWKVLVSSSAEKRAKVAALIIAIFGASDVGVEISILGGTKDSVVVGVQNEILLNAQSINGLYQVSQLCPRTAEQLESNGVMKKVMECVSLVGNQS